MGQLWHNNHLASRPVASSSKLSSFQLRWAPPGRQGRRALIHTRGDVCVAFSRMTKSLRSVLTFFLQQYYMYLKVMSLLTFRYIPHIREQLFILAKNKKRFIEKCSMYAKLKHNKVSEVALLEYLFCFNIQFFICIHSPLPPFYTRQILIHVFVLSYFEKDSWVSWHFWQPNIFAFKCFFWQAFHQ